MNTPSQADIPNGGHPVSGNEFNGFTSVDVGSPRLRGSARVVDGGWDVTAGGADIWEQADEFHYLFKRAAGDFDIAVRVERFVAAHLYSKAGLMIRETLAADSAHLMFLVFSTNEPRNNNLGACEMQFRATAGGGCQAVYPSVRPPQPPEFPAAFPNSWLRLKRRGNLFSALASVDGTAWKLYAELTLALGTTVHIGPALTSHQPDTAAQATFRDYRETA